MKNFSKLSGILLLSIVSNLNVLSQEGQHADSSSAKPSPPLYESKNGFTLPVSGTIRILVIFIEVNYDTGKENCDCPAGTSAWPAHSLPVWANQLFDANVPSGLATGLFTRYFQLASSGNYNVLGDYLLSPTNGGIFTINNSGGQPAYATVAAAVNTAMGGKIVTGSGLNDIRYFDNWTKTGACLPKETPSIDNPPRYDHIMFIWRNANFYASGTGSAAGGDVGFDILGYRCDSYSQFVTFHNMPLEIARHEFSHLLLGGNNFHTGGGGWGSPNDYWVAGTGGWGILGLYNSTLQTWSAWDRQRFDWRPAGNIYNPSCRDRPGVTEMDGDLDATVPADTGYYYLRDFATTGDAIRIKLPFINPVTEYPEYIWIENHNGVAMNGVVFDKWQYQDVDCVQPAVYGLHMYLQIDKDIRQSTKVSDVIGGDAMYTRPITAEGFYDREFESTTTYNDCVTDPQQYAFTRKPKKANPLTGSGDVDVYALDLNKDSVLDHTDGRLNIVEKINGSYHKNLFYLGHTRHVFTLSGNKKLGIGTNPSSASMMNLMGFDRPAPAAKNLRKIYLNGVSVEIIDQFANGGIVVRVRFDDVDVDNDVRWCADTIVLNPIASGPGYSLNLKKGRIITIDQGLTATRMDKPQTIKGSNVFASPTVFKCLADSYFHLEPKAKVILDNNSKLILKSGSKLVIEKGARLIVQHGSTLEVEVGAQLIVRKGGKVIRKK